MNRTPTANVIRSLRRLVAPPDPTEATDRQLLERFARHRDEAAFAAVVRRHGPLVLGVGRRVLGNYADAEDAFQATFLVLARKAGAVRWQDSVAGWLFQVAYHLGLKMKTQSQRRAHSVPVPEYLPAAPSRHADPELRVVLDEELSRLPERYRLALLLCLAEGKTRDQAARELGWKPGAVKIRLERGRQLLRARLARRGLALSAAGLAAALAENVAPAATLVNTTVTAAASFAEVPGTLSGPAAVLARAMLRSFLATRLKLAAVLVAVVAVMAAGAGVIAQGGVESQPPESAERDEPVVPPKVPAPAKPAAPVVVPAINRPVRVLLFGDGPTREFQFVRRLFVQEVDRKRAELSICLQSAQQGAAQDVPPERLLERFPARFDPKDEGASPAERYANLDRYDLLIAFDPDWSRLEEKQAKLLEAWVRAGRGLIVIASPLNTYQLARGVNREKLQSIINLYPVVVEDSRVVDIEQRSGPARLEFADARAFSFLKLDADGTTPLAGWETFFTGREDKPAGRERPVVRGFFQCYPGRDPKRGATVLAVPVNQGHKVNRPYLVTMPVGKGKVVYLASGETWRLRQFRPEYFNRFWTGLARHAAGLKPIPVPKPAPPAEKGAGVDSELEKRVARLIGDLGNDRFAVREQAEAELAKIGVPAEDLLRRALLRKPSLEVAVRMERLLGEMERHLSPEQKAVHHGLQWLAKKQMRDGHWETQTRRPLQTTTALAGLAFLMEGSTLSEGRYSNTIRRTVNWLMERAQRDGLIGRRFDDAERGDSLIRSHALATLFLASVYGEEEDNDRRRRIQDVLTNAVRFSENAQASAGGWGQTVGVKIDSPDIRSTILQIQALGAVRCAGIPVSSQVLKKGRTYLAEQVDSSTTLAVSATAAISPDDYTLPFARKWLRYGARRKLVFGEEKDGLVEGYLTFCAIRVAFGLGEDDFGRLFPATHPGERITWRGVRKSVFPQLLARQRPDGSWGKERGDTVATAVRLLVLQLEKGALPAFQR